MYHSHPFGKAYQIMIVQCHKAISVARGGILEFYILPLIADRSKCKIIRALNAHEN